MAALRWQRLDGCFGVALPKWGAEGYVEMAVWSWRIAEMAEVQSG